MADILFIREKGNCAQSNPSSRDFLAVEEGVGSGSDLVFGGTWRGSRTLVGMHRVRDGHSAGGKELVGDSDVCSTIGKGMDLNDEDSEMNFAAFSAANATGTHFVTTGGQLPVTKLQQSVSNNGNTLQQ
ncbi:hypothetical protein MSG28_003962, partial [Choristoneura fumiferana]